MAQPTVEGRRCVAVVSRLARRHLAAFCAAGLVLLTLAGCRRSKGPQTICAIPQLATQEVYLTERAGMEEAAAGSDLQIDWQGPSDSDPQRQISMIGAATEARSYGIAINPVGSNTTDSAILAALSRGIPVVVLRDPIKLPPQPHLSFLLEDYAAGAELIARRLRHLFASGGEVAILGVDPYSASSLARLDAIESVLHTECPRIRVVDRVVAPYSSGLVQVAAKKELEQYPRLVAFIALNNRAGLGAAMAVTNKAPAHPVRVLAYDQAQPMLLRLRRGQVDSIVVQNMRLMGRLAVANIEADRRKSPYAQLRRLPPMLVTADNIDSDAVQDALLLNWETP